MKEKRFSRFSLVLFLFLSMITSGCGYTNQAVLPANIQTIYVQTVKNKIPVKSIYAYHPGLEMQITNAILNRLHQDGNLKVVTRDDADAVLEADLIRFEQEGVRFDSLEAVEEFRLFIVLTLVLRDGKTGDVIWKEANFSGDTEYFVSNVRSIARGEAVDRAIGELARNVVDRIVEDW